MWFSHQRPAGPKRDTYAFVASILLKTIWPRGGYVEDDIPFIPTPSDQRWDTARQMAMDCVRPNTPKFGAVGAASSYRDELPSTTTTSASSRTQPTPESVTYVAVNGGPMCSDNVTTSVLPETGPDYGPWQIVVLATAQPEPGDEYDEV